MSASPRPTAIAKTPKALTVADQSPDSYGALVLDTVALLEGTVTPEDYRSKWVSAQEAPLPRIVF